MNTRALTYTPDGQIQSIKDNDKLIATYQYNHLRQRVSKTVYQKDNQTNQTKEDTTYYLWDKGLLSAEIKDDKVVRRYIYLDIMPVAVLDYDYNDKGKIKNTQVYSIHTDHLGTPKAITNDKQETVWQIDLDTFGEVKQIQSKDNFTFNLRFAGQYHDNETGYHYNYHRYYDPTTGRYLTSDPIGLNGGSLNTYAYVDGRPYEFVDPLGLYTLDFARNKLIAEGVPKLGYMYTTSRRSGRIKVPIHSDIQIFEKWYSLEKADLSKPNNWTTNLPRCPRKIKTGKGAKNGSQWLEVGKANSEHKPGVWEMRSITIGESSNQCVYDAQGNIMLEIPAAGTADRYACPNLGECWYHTWHDLEPWLKAKELDGQCKADKYKKMYYEVRPVLVNSGGIGGSW